MTIFNLIKTLFTKQSAPSELGFNSSSEIIKPLTEFRPFDKQAKSIQILIAGTSEIKKYRFGDLLFKVGEYDEMDYFLIQGSVLMRAQDGKDYTIDAGSDMANMPLGMLRPRQLAARVSSLEATLYEVPHSAVEMVHEDVRGLNLDIPILEVLIDDVPKSTMLERVQKDIISGELSLVSLPEVALRVKDACEDSEASLGDIAKIINRDPAMAVKISGAANSALYKGVSEVANVQDAVSRLGKQITKHLIVYFATKELFVAKQKILEKVFRDSWLAALDRAVMAQTIAKLSGNRFDPDEAFLCGLLFRIGDLLMLQYLSKNIKNLKELEKINHITEQESVANSYLTVNKWNLPKSVSEVLKKGASWTYRSSNEEGDYTDLIVATNVLLRVKNKKITGLPKFDQIPALSKIMNSNFAENTSVMLEYNKAMEIFKSL